MGFHCGSPSRETDLRRFMPKQIKDRPQCALILENANGEILLQLRDNNLDILCPNVWGTFGGQIEDRETPEEATAREIGEEIGYDLKNSEYVGNFPYEGYDTFVFRKVDPAVRIEDLRVREGQKGEFFSREKIETIHEWAFNCGEIVEAYFRKYQ